jgi:hypothetical protein
MKRIIIILLLLIFSGCRKEHHRLAAEESAGADNISKNIVSNENDSSATPDTSSEVATLPSVICGSGKCITGETGNTCCLSAKGAGVSSPTCQKGCKIVDQITAYQALCDEHSDCEGAQLCCVTGGKYSFVADCREPNMCNWTDTSGGSLEVCKSPAIKIALSCSKGTACTKTVPGYTDWLFCELPQKDK